MKYFVFYYDCYEVFDKVFSTEEEVSKFLESRNWSSPGNSFRVIVGQELEMEPVDKVVSWKIKRG